MDLSGEIKLVAGCQFLIKIINYEAPVLKGIGEVQTSGNNNKPKFHSRRRAHRIWGMPTNNQPISSELFIFKIYSTINLSLGFLLTEHHAMKAYWGSGCIAPLIL
jgi:hypothetical protein